MRLGGIVYACIQMLDYLDVHNHNHNNNNIIVYGNRATIQTPARTRIRFTLAIMHMLVWCSLAVQFQSMLFYCAKSCVHETPRRHEIVPFVQLSLLSKYISIRHIIIHAPDDMHVPTNSNREITYFENTPHNTLNNAAADYAQ